MASAKIPRLTPAQFKKLVAHMRDVRANTRGRPLSEKTEVLARAVLVDGMGYQQAANEYGSGNKSAAYQAVKLLMQYYGEDGMTARVYEGTPELFQQFDKVAAKFKPKGS
ncbi:hypothetical protein [Burkholderia sp. BCC1993]|uniref:hypothetical protein n=1 Tax=Burkholderia sp. BCC1993 TaxID=2817444 RepID=UPI002AAF7B6A|nr:hypothetical protein [Burkholderia sp. BCC1993]